MDHFKKIYASKAAEYQELIQAEDADGNLPARLNEIVPFSGQIVLDLGSGTGRIPLIVFKHAAQVIGSDLNFPMLSEQLRVRQQAGGSWPLVNADNRQLPFRAGSVDIITAGWAIGHLRGWYPDDWQVQIGRILDEMVRVSKPGGRLIIIETMTTGALSPSPPSAGLAEYYHWLEETWGFNRSVIRTDYQFESIEDAVEKTTFFFGEDLAGLIRENSWVRLPEWTGVWHKRI